jgi:hypothetical protein
MVSAARERLVRVIDLILAEWEAGLDHQWTNGEPTSALGPYDVLVWAPDDPDYASLNGAWHYIDGFADARWHGFRDLDGVTWEESLATLRALREALASGEPVTDERVLAAARLRAPSGLRRS